MSVWTDNLDESLAKLGLKPDEIQVYLQILKSDAVTPLELSRVLKMGRTKVYRVLEELQAKTLVEQLVDGNGSKFSAALPKALEKLVKEKEAELEEIKNSAPQLMEQLTALKTNLHGKTKVIYYKGIEGLKQITWNSLSAKNSLRIFEIETMGPWLDVAFAEKVRMELVLRKVVTKQVVNVTKLEPYTKIKELVKFWELRNIPEDLLKINLETLTYNDVYAMYSYEGSEIFGVEIYNQGFAKMQQQIFDIVWQAATPMKIIGQNGEASL